ncbi:type I DNA topoisomerase [Candidatus Uhrbacteria bacterium]|nr:type I DNA topoisomerase [Candidatus Uhrbacteria bacterium]
MPKLLIVESPTKAKTISKFLGKDFTVLSSFGHVRDLPKSKIGVDVEHGFEPTYTIPTDSKKHVTELKAAAKKSEDILLATDEDREGEAIAWHVAQVIGLDPKEAKRITFHEITRSAIEEAVAHPREINMNVVNAQQARRVLDRLVGYELSPFLWQKVRYGLSAGRVQSVAMRLIVEREREREAFKIDEFWTIDALFDKSGVSFPAKLAAIGDKKLDKLDIKTQAQAQQIVDDLVGKKATVTAVEKKEMTKAPPPPFTTSSLQIDANTKLGFSAKQTMALAQKLYETGRITYMRTDSLNLAEKFLSEAQTFIGSAFGKRYATGAKRYKTSRKGAQEAHEAIRPTDVSATPDQMKGTLEPRDAKLYELIWRRALASQLPPAVLERTAVDLLAHLYLFRANGSTVVFDGFMKVYQATKEKLLPPLNQGDAVATKEIVPNQHFTEPPARYSDATLVKALEEFGIGRPSTYAPTISTIIERGYVERDENKKLFPMDIALIVTDLLVKHFQNIVDYAFTAKMEKNLDDVEEGTIEWAPMLEQFYQPFHQNLESKTKELNREDIMPDRTLGTDPQTALPVIVRTGRFGAFVQVGEYSEQDKKDKKPKPKSASLLKGMNAESVTLEQALACLAFPRDLGKTPQGDAIAVAVGRFGPYVKAGEVSASIKEPFDPISITYEQAVELLRTSAELKKQMAQPLAELGEDPVSKGTILIKQGRFGPYVTDGKTNASIGKKRDPATLTLDEAAELLEKKRTGKTKSWGRKKKA